MARVVYAARAFRDLERLADALLDLAPRLAARALARISEAVTVLGEHPLIGRAVEHGLRELVISRGKTGYVALYEYLEAHDVVRVLAVRHQREAGFPENP